MYQIAVLPGDGIGREIIPVAVQIMKQVAGLFRLNLQIEHGLISEDAFAREGHPLPPSTLALCQNSVAVLLGAWAVPKWTAYPGVATGTRRFASAQKRAWFVR